MNRSIATCFQEAHKQYEDYPEVAAHVRKGAVLCRQQFDESTMMLEKVRQTAGEVLSMFPDLELAIEEDEPKLAADFFEVVKGWVSELREQVASTQKINKASMNQIQKVVEQSSLGLKEEQRQRTVQYTSQLIEDVMRKLSLTSASGNPITSQELTSGRLDSTQVLDLFCAMFSQFNSHRRPNNNNNNNNGNSNSNSNSNGNNLRNTGRERDSFATVTTSTTTINNNVSDVNNTNGMDVEVTDVSPCSSPFPSTQKPFSGDDDGSSCEYTVQSPESVPLPPPRKPLGLYSTAQVNGYHHGNGYNGSSGIGNGHTSGNSSGSEGPSRRGGGGGAISPLTLLSVEMMDSVPPPPMQSLVTQQGALEITREHPTPKGPSRLTEALQKLGEVSGSLLIFCLLVNCCC
jgi:hypothetical protein